MHMLWGGVGWGRIDVLCISEVFLASHTPQDVVNIFVVGNVTFQSMMCCMEVICVAESLVICTVFSLHNLYVVLCRCNEYACS